MKALSTLLAVFSALFLIAPVYSQADAKKPSETFKKAEAYFYQKKFEMAEVLLQEELRSNPENAVAYTYLGDIFLEKKLMDGALSLYKKALDLNPNDAQTMFHIGDIYYEKQMGAQAIEQYRKAFITDTRLKISYYHVGLTYLMLLRDKKGVIENWESYLRIAPEDPQYEKIRRVLELLKDPNFEIPPVGSEISIEEALHLGGSVLQKGEVKTNDKSADHEGKKNTDKKEDIFRDDALQ
jgi:tetratricopeptide (TPR) repeat protein